MRPTRSWCFTSQYFCLTRARSVSLLDAMRSLITLNTYGYDGSVNTVITRPLMPGATTNLSRECLRWCRKSRKNRLLPCFCRPTIVYISDPVLSGSIDSRKSTYAEGTSMSTRKYARLAENSTASSRSPVTSASTYSRPSAVCLTATTNGRVWMPLTTRPAM